MMRISNCIRAKLYGSMFKSVLTYCFVVFFSFLFAGELSSAIGDYQAKRTITFKEFTVLSPSYLSTSLLSPHHLPFESTPAPQQRQVPNEYESEEDFEDESNPFVGGHLSENQFYISFRATAFQPLTFSISNLSTVPFFILYHSWKSFIS